MAVGPHTGGAKEERALFECGAVAEGSHALGGKRGRPRDTASEERKLLSFALKLPRRGGESVRDEAGENNGGGRLKVLLDLDHQTKPVVTLDELLAGAGRRAPRALCEPGRGCPDASASCTVTPPPSAGPPGARAWGERLRLRSPK